MMSMSPLTTIALCSFLLLEFVVETVTCMKILLTNDDGFESNNIQALFRALINEGHDVIMTAPYSGQDMSGGKLEFLTPIGPTTVDSPGGKVLAGADGIGPTGLGDHQFYVDTTPVGAALYGIDVKAPELFGGPPDLLVSGPNRGLNMGLSVPHSGTIGAAVTALNKGIPAIAISAYRGDDSDREAELIAGIAITVINKVTDQSHVMLEAGIGLTVSIPRVSPSKQGVDDFEIRLTEVGTAQVFGYRFYEKLGESRVANSFGISSDMILPGVSAETPYTEAGYPEDTNEDSEGNVITIVGPGIPLGTVVTVSPIQGTFATQADVRLQKLFRATNEDEEDERVNSRHEETNRDKGKKKKKCRGKSKSYHYK